MIEFSEGQRELIGFLQRTVHIDEPKKLDSGFSDIEDNIKLAKWHVCDCGARMQINQHKVEPYLYHKLDNYHLECPRCHYNKTICYKIVNR